LVSTITAPTAIRAIGCDDDNQYLFGNNWSTAVNIFNLTGAVQSTFTVGPFGASYYGFAYDNHSVGGPYVWGYAQVGTSLEWLVQMTYPAGVETGKTYDVGTALGHVGGNAGGLAITPAGTFPAVAPGEWSIFGIMQNTSMWAVELAELDPNPCYTPTGLAISNRTGTTADFEWMDAAAAGTYDIVWGLAGFDPEVGPYTGTAYGEVYAAAPYTYNLTGLTNGVTYDAYVRAVCGGTAGNSAWVSATFISAPPPANDDCATAETVVGPYPTTVNGTTIGSTIDCAGVLDWNAVWYEVDLPFAVNNLNVDYCGTGDQATIGIVYYNDCSDCSAYTVASSYSFYDCGTPGGVTVGLMDFNGIAGPGTVFFPAYMGAEMDFVVTFDVTEAVAGAGCENTALYPSGVITVNGAGLLTTISTCNYAGEYGQITGFVTGETYEFAMSDLGTGAYVTITDGPPTGANILAYGPSPLSWTATTTGDLYAHWSLDEYCSTDAACHVTTVQCLTCATILPPVNDDCAAATAIGEVTDLAFNTTYATVDTYGSCMTSANIWYNYTATTDGNLTVSLCGSSFDTKLALFDEFDCGIMVELACNDDACGLQSEIVWGPVTAGETFKIEVGGYGTAVGEGILNVSVTNPMFDVSGTITYANLAMTPMDVVTVELTGYGSDVTDVAGMYSGIMAPDGNYTLMSTTTKAHGGLNGLDVILTRRYIGSLITFTPIQVIAADVNENGAPDGLDVIMMKRRIGSLSYPAWTAPEYIFYDENITIAGAAVVHDYQSLCSGDVNGSHTPEIQTPPAPVNDLCSNPTAIAGPYPQTGIVGTTVGATMDCPAILNMASGEVWYAIDLPYAVNDVTVDLCGDALLDDGWIVGTTVQCSCDLADYLYGAGFSFTPPCVSGLTWTAVPGPGTFYYPVATGTYQEGFTMDVNVTEYVPPLYCAASTTTQDECIGDVICGTINNLATGWQGGVADYTAISTSIAAGASEPITVNSGCNLWASDLVEVWVDWNNDFTFGVGTDEEFILTNNGTGAVFTGSIDVPAGTAAGSYRMRVRMSYSISYTPCGVGSYGEVEDYTIVVP
jgi:hypothetical protein